MNYAQFFHRAGAGRRMVVGGHNVNPVIPFLSVWQKAEQNLSGTILFSFFVWQLSLARWLGFALCTSLPAVRPPHTDAEVKLKHTVNNGNGSLMSIKEIILRSTKFPTALRPQNAEIAFWLMPRPRMGYSLIWRWTPWSGLHRSRPFFSIQMNADAGFIRSPGTPRFPPKKQNRHLARNKFLTQPLE